LNNKFLIKVVRNTKKIYKYQTTISSDYEMYLQELDYNIGAKNDFERE